jgi:hypothetical protein
MQLLSTPLFSLAIMGSLGDGSSMKGEAIRETNPVGDVTG